jgi:hypothetical protein
MIEIKQEKDGDLEWITKKKEKTEYSYSSMNVSSDS